MARLKQKIDEQDRKLLERLQSDSSVSLEELAAHTGMSTNTAWRRIKRLEEIGVITKRVALVWE